MDFQLKRAHRILLMIFLPLAVFVVCACVRSGRHGSGCVFYELTGLYCPGCGSGRALFSLLHGNWRAAVKHNALFLPLGVPAAFVFLHEYLRLIFPGLRLRPVPVPHWLTSGCCILILLFWFFRNLPAFFFLAP